MATATAAVGKENQDPNNLVPAKGQLGNGPSGQTEPTDLKDGEPQDNAPPEPHKDPKLRRRVLPNPITDALSPQHLKQGVLIPLKTTQEVRQDHTIVQALITRAPTKSANVVLE
ncbi:tRNA-specific adenosine deaminase subunit-like protein [Emericellopsis cladophorae]|uniref:tRNA-specific adenosine deaminase subunit-like protein n=1 Tax=Emericellopsis cladophorae TaxID=2686198 RepID=A0A9P9Y0Z4_9HYPO|nr:tRNA-specific adenosine deaminase subunit-like protein [Emericellopsis cladophorae]KAI6781360.1 tRNA-specific adenosine deaminase subunit-like protein [Emericellopsis cladophorae]